MSTPTYLEKFRYGGMSFTVCTFSSERDVNIVFEVEFLAPSKDSIDAIVARFQSDLGLKLCIALYYGVAVRHIDPMIHVDEEDDENDGFYLSINGPRCIDLLDMVSSQIGIFNVMAANLNLAASPMSGYPTASRQRSAPCKIEERSRRSKHLPSEWRSRSGISNPISWKPWPSPASLETPTCCAL